MKEAVDVFEGLVEVLHRRVIRNLEAANLRFDRGELWQQLEGRSVEEMRQDLSERLPEVELAANRAREVVDGVFDVDHQRVLDVVEVDLSLQLHHGVVDDVEVSEVVACVTSEYL